MTKKITLDFRKYGFNKSCFLPILLLGLLAFIPYKQVEACHGTQVTGATYVYNPATDQTTITIQIDQTLTDGIGSETSTFTVEATGCVGNITGATNFSATMTGDANAYSSMGGCAACDGSGGGTVFNFSWVASVSGAIATYTYTGGGQPTFGTCAIDCAGITYTNGVAGTQTLGGFAPTNMHTTQVLVVEGYATGVSMNGNEGGGCDANTDMDNSNASAPPSDAGALVDNDGINVICFGETKPLGTITDNGAAILSSTAQLWMSVSGTSSTNGASGSLTGTQSLIETCDGVGGTNTTAFVMPGYNDAEDAAIVAPEPTITSANPNANSIISNYVTYYLGSSTGTPIAVPDASNSLQYILLPDITVATSSMSCDGAGNLVITMQLQGGYPTPGSPGAGSNYTVSNASLGSFSTTTPSNLSNFTITIPAASVPAVGTSISFDVVDGAPTTTTTGPCTKSLSVATTTVCAVACPALATDPTGAAMTFCSPGGALTGTTAATAVPPVGTTNIYLLVNSAGVIVSNATTPAALVAPTNAVGASCAANTNDLYTVYNLNYDTGLGLTAIVNGTTTITTLADASGDIIGTAAACMDLSAAGVNVTVLSPIVVFWGVQACNCTSTAYDQTFTICGGSNAYTLSALTLNGGTGIAAGALASGTYTVTGIAPGSTISFTADNAATPTGAACDETFTNTALSCTPCPGLVSTTLPTTTSFCENAVAPQAQMSAEFTLANGVLTVTSNNAGDVISLNAASTATNRIFDITLAAPADDCNVEKHTICWTATCSSTSALLGSGQFDLTVYPIPAATAVLNNTDADACEILPITACPELTVMYDVNTPAGDGVYESTTPPSNPAPGTTTTVRWSASVTGAPSGCSATGNYDVSCPALCLCPTVNVFNDNSSICSGALGAEFTNFETAVEGANPTVPVAQVFLSSVPYGMGGFPLATLPNGLNNGCEPLNQIVYAYILCDADCDADLTTTDIGNTITYAGSYTLTVNPNPTVCLVDKDDCSFEVTSCVSGTTYSVFGVLGGAIAANFDPATGIYTATPGELPGSVYVQATANSCFNGSTDIHTHGCEYNCPVTTNVSANNDICHNTLGTTLSDWQAAVASDPINAAVIADVSVTNGTILYSSVLVDGTIVTVPDGIVATGVHSDPTLCCNEIQTTYAYIICYGADGAAGGGDDSYLLVGTFTLTIFPPAQNPTLVMSDACAVTLIPACGTTIGTASNPIGTGVEIGDFAPNVYTADPGDVAGSLDISISSDAGICPAIIYTLPTPACPVICQPGQGTFGN